MSKPDNPPAFPDPCGAHPGFYQPWGAHPPHEAKGMTLRDWFAGQALASNDYYQSEYATIKDLRQMTGECYRMADAMLAERGKGETA